MFENAMATRDGRSASNESPTASKSAVKAIATAHWWGRVGSEQLEAGLVSVEKAGSKGILTFLERLKEASARCG